MLARYARTRRRRASSASKPCVLSCRLMAFTVMAAASKAIKLPTRNCHSFSQPPKVPTSICTSHNQLPAAKQLLHAQHLRAPIPAYNKGCSDREVLFADSDHRKPAMISPTAPLSNARDFIRRRCAAILDWLQIKPVSAVRESLERKPAGRSQRSSLRQG